MLILLLLAISFTGTGTKTDFICNSDNTGNLEHEVNQIDGKFQFKAYYCGFTKNYTVKKFKMNKSENIIHVDIVMSGPKEPEALNPNKINFSRSMELDPGEFLVKTEIDVEAEREYSRQDKLEIKSEGFLTKILNGLKSFLEGILKGFIGIISSIL
jgi:hypothetical protein